MQAMTDALVAMFAEGTVDGRVVADDVLADINVPDWRFQIQGRAALEAWLRDEVGPGNDVDAAHAEVAGHLAVLEIVTRSRKPGVGLSRQLCIARHEQDAITSVVIYCTGVWSAEHEARHRAEVTLARPGLVWQR